MDVYIVFFLLQHETLSKIIKLFSLKSWCNKSTKTFVSVLINFSFWSGALLTGEAQIQKEDDPMNQTQAYCGKNFFS